MPDSELYHEQKRVDSQARWEMMKPYLDESDRTALDIGCASGFFTGKLAEYGLSVVGIDKKRSRLDDARREFGAQDGVEFVKKTITPESVHSLPDADVVLLLTVYHHWARNFGLEEAEEILRVIGSKANSVFFEPPGFKASWFKYIESRPVEPGETPAAYFDQELSRVFGENVIVTHIGDTEYPESDLDTDPIFWIDCSAFTRP